MRFLMKMLGSGLQNFYSLNIYIRLDEKLGFKKKMKIQIIEVIKSWPPHFGSFGGLTPSS